MTGTRAERLRDGGVDASFEAAPGWRLERFPMPGETCRIQTGPEADPGIDGGIGAVAVAPFADGRRLAQLTMPVRDPDAAMTRVREAGERVIEGRMPIPGVGWTATCTEPGGLCFGPIQAVASTA